MAQNDVAFRTATAFFDAPAGVNLQVDIAPGNSTSVMNSIATFNYNLTANETYVLVVEGILPGNPINNGALALDVISSKDLEVEVDIINLQGQVLSSRANVVLIKGQTVLEQNVSNFAAGNYFIRLSTNDAQLTIPVTVQ